MDGEIDHRIQDYDLCNNRASNTLIRNQPFYFTHKNAYQDLCALFTQYSQGEIVENNKTIVLEGRELVVIAQSQFNIWFDFTTLCLGPRSPNDYIALNNIYKSIFISNVTQMGEELHERKIARGTEDTYNINQKVADSSFILAKNDDAARRFISLVDECYDQGVLFIISAEVAIEKLYLRGRVLFEFERTMNHLIEMKKTLQHPYKS